MRDNAFLQIVRPALVTGLTAAGVADIAVKQSFQPTQQGAETGPTVYLHKVGDVRRGSPSRTEEWDGEHSQMVHTETTWYETTWQVNALASQDPNDIDALTAADIVNTAAAVMQGQAMLDTLASHDLGVLRVGDVRHPYFSDDRDRNEAAPSFDFVVTHQQIVVTTVPVIQSTEYRVQRV